jgi:uncharacterized protein
MQPLDLAEPGIAPEETIDDFLQRRGFVDCDVHALISEGGRGMYQYMTKAWQQRFDEKGFNFAVGAAMRYRPMFGIERSDAEPPSGGRPGSDPEWVVKDHLDRQNVSTALLFNLESAALCGAGLAPDDSVIAASAANDYFLEQWLPVDHRFRFAMVVPSQDPEAAAKEIRRIGQDKRIAAIYLPAIGISLGNRWYWPIYREAAALGLPIALHVHGTEFVMNGSPMAGGGWPESYAERFASLPLVAGAHLSSLIFSGVFERFPGLKVLFVEYGFTWALGLFWRFDNTWRATRTEVPWVRKAPSEYLHENIRFATQPLDDPSDPTAVARFIELFGAEHLCFSTDYPHWDSDMPSVSLTSLPESSQEAILSANARSFLPLDR